MFDVIVAPPDELHVGINKPLIDTPPPGVNFFHAPHKYIFTCIKEDIETFDPYQHFSLAESVLFDLDPSHPFLVQAALTPVANPIPWIIHAETIFPLQSLGKMFCVGQSDQVREGRVPSKLTRLRARLMALRYLSVNCKAILFYTNVARNETIDYLDSEGILDSAEMDLFLAKVDVLYPTMPHRRRKSTDERVGVLYAGRVFGHKGGAIALEVFSRLLPEYEARFDFHFVGETPETILSSDYPGIQFHRFLPRNEYLAILETCDIFVAPTRGETYGMALIEAASYGAALVTSSGCQMAHLGEIFDEGQHALYVPHELSDERQTDEFERHLRLLLGDPQSLAHMQKANSDLFNTGKMSMDNCHRKLLKVYESALGEASGDPDSSEATTLGDQSDLQLVERSLTSYQIERFTEELSKRKSLYVVL